MNEIINKEPVQRVIKALEKFDKNIQIQILKDTARTSKDAANALNCEEGAIVKSLVFKAETEFLICLISNLLFLKLLEALECNDLYKNPFLFTTIIGHI